MNEDNERVWVMSSATPTERGGNGLHYKDCYTFRSDRWRPQLATPEQIATLKHCTKCGGAVGQDQYNGGRPRFCPVCSYALTANGQCSNDQCTINN